MSSAKQYTFDQIIQLKNLPVIAIDEDSQITYANSAFETEFGWSSNELIGQSLTILIPPLFRTGHRIGIHHSVAQHPKEIKVQHDDFSVLRKDGSEQWCEHIVVGKKNGERWEFAAVIKPIPMPLQDHWKH